MTKLEKIFSRLVATAQPCQVKSVSIHEQCNFRMQFWGNKMWNHVLYPTLLIALKILVKEGAVVDTIFCLSLICVLNPENSKNTIFSLWCHGNI